MITLEKIDQVVERTGVSYKEAREALENNAGDVLEAIIYLEEAFNEETEEKSVQAGDILETVKEYLRIGNVSRIIVSKNGETLINLPVVAGALTLVLAPLVSIIGAGVAIVSDINLYIIDHNGKVHDINKITKDKIDLIKKKSEEIKNTATKSAQEFKDKFKKDAKEEAEEIIEEVKQLPFVEEEIVEDLEEKIEESL